MRTKYEMHNLKVMTVERIYSVLFRWRSSPVDQLAQNESPSTREKSTVQKRGTFSISSVEIIQKQHKGKTGLLLIVGAIYYLCFLSCFVFTLSMVHSMMWIHDSVAPEYFSLFYFSDLYVDTIIILLDILAAISPDLFYYKFSGAAEFPGYRSTGKKSFSSMFLFYFFTSSVHICSFCVNFL